MDDSLSTPQAPAQDLWAEPLDRPLTLGAALRRVAERHPDNLFATFVDTGRTLTYGELDTAANRFARGLAARGLAAGDYVAIMLSNVPEMLVAQYGAYKAGVVAAVLNADFRGPSLARLVNLTAARMLITADEHLQAVEAVADALEVRPTVVLTTPVTRSEHVPFEEVLSDDGTDSNVELHPTAIASVLFTSGTTGPSKGCMLSHRFAITSAATVVRAMRMTAADCVYAPYPLHHYAASYNDVLPALLAGGRVAIRRRFSASGFWPDVREHGATVFEMIGSTAKILADRPPLEDDADNPARVFWGGPLPADETAFCRRFDLHLSTGFGSTDMNNVTYRRRLEGEPPGSVGERVPLFDLRIADEFGDPVPAGSAGELLVRGKEAGLLCSGYLGMPEATVEAWQDLWHHTGDLARFDEHGRLWYLGRKRDSIRRAGENVSPFEVEEGLHLHDAVAEAAVIGVPSPLGEQLIKAYVVVRAGAEATADELRAHCSEHLARFMVPDEIAFVEHLPRTPTGKVARRELEQMCAVD